MLLTVLSVPECPSAGVLLDRIEVALGERAADIDVVVLDDDHRARRWGMTGSPTLLVGGVDPFAAGGTEGSVSCRLYRGTDGTVSGAPSVAELVAVFAAAGTSTPAADGARLDAVGRSGRGRLAPVEHGLRAVQRAALRALADTGLPPRRVELDRAAEPYGRPVAEVLRDLATEDFLTLDQNGEIRALYPFSVPASRHRVRVAAGPDVWAMCALDALGIPAMLGRAVGIDTTDPITAQAITVHVGLDGAVRGPDDSVMFLGRRGCLESAEQACCDLINFFGSRHSAARWAALNTDARGELMGLEAAAELGRSIFGALLHDG